MNSKKAPGKGFLKVVGILLIIIGVFSLATSGLNLVVLGSEEGKAIVEQAIIVTGITMEAYQLSLGITAIQGLLNLVIGILGIINCNKIEKANICFICGIVLIVFVLAMQAFNAANGAFSILNIVFGLILPLLYFWGALKNRQAAQEGFGSSDL